MLTPPPDLEAPNPEAPDPGAPDPEAPDPEAPDPEELEPAVPGATVLATLHRYRRWLGLTFALWLAVVLGGGIFISALDARTGLHVFGPQVWVAGEPGVLRVGLRDLEFTRFEPVAALDVWFLPMPAGVAVADWPPPTEAELAGPSQRLAEPAEGFVQGAVVPPGPGAHRLHLVATTDRGPVTVDLPVQVLPAGTPPAPPTPQRPEGPPRPDRGPLKIDLFATDHALPGDLPTEIALRVTDANGAPQSLPVALKLQEGRSTMQVPERVHTDRFGLARFPFKGQEPRLWIDLEAPAPEVPPPTPEVPPVAPEVANPEVPAPEIPAPEIPAPEIPAPEVLAPAAPAPDPRHTQVARRIKRTPTQHVITVPDRPVAPGAAVKLSVALLHRKAERVFVDAWLGERWVAATTLEVAAGVGQGAITLPPNLPDPALVWIQVYGGAYLPQQARGGRYVVVGTAPELDLVRHAAQTLAAAGIDAAWNAHLAADPNLQTSALRPMLGRADRPPGDPPLLANSTDSVRQHVAALKLRWQRRFIVALLGTGLLMFGLLAWVIRQNGRAVRAGWAAAGGEAELGGGTRAGMAREAVPIFLILALFLLGLVFLLHQIRW